MYTEVSNLPVKPNWGLDSSGSGRQDDLLVDSVADGVARVVDDGGEYCWTDSGSIVYWSWDSGSIVYWCYRCCDM